MFPSQPVDMQSCALLVSFDSAKLGLGTEREREREVPQMSQGIFAKYKDSEAPALVDASHSSGKKHVVFDC